MNPKMGPRSQAALGVARQEVALAAQQASQQEGHAAEKAFLDYQQVAPSHSDPDLCHVPLIHISAKPYMYL